jgi:hypothetical protein
VIPDDIWTDQDEFNLLLRPPPHEHGETVVRDFLRDMALNMNSECDELLRTTSWKSHRRQTNRPNREHRLEEVIDKFKIWLTEAQGLGFTQEELRQAYWRKSMVVRQRHSEEWVRKLDGPTWIVDIDNVLCDYTTGFCNWIINRAPLFAAAAQRIIQDRTFFSSCADFGMTETEWQGFKHEFRSMGHKRWLPLMPGAREFLLRLRDAGYYIVLLTSRPIDRYPNIYTDTLFWLRNNDLPFDWLWWSTEKGERLIENGAVKHIAGVVDDDPKYVVQFGRLGLEVWWLQTTQHRSDVMPGAAGYVHAITSLSNVVVPSVIVKGVQSGPRLS